MQLDIVHTETLQTEWHLLQRQPYERWYLDIGPYRAGIRLNPDGERVGADISFGGERIWAMSAVARVGYTLPELQKEIEDVIRRHNTP